MVSHLNRFFYIGGWFAEKTVYEYKPEDEEPWTMIGHVDGDDRTVVMYSLMVSQRGAKKYILSGLS